MNLNSLEKEGRTKRVAHKEEVVRAAV